MGNSLIDIDGEYNTLIIGGGIVGAGIFRDLSLHSVKALLIDKFDFASQTSSSSSKMFHGGIRYLASLDFGLVWEALHEKNLWLKLAPHLCIERPFLIPTYKQSANGLLAMHLGVKLYDLLSSFQNSPSKALSRTNIKKAYPCLTQENLTGGVIYYDAIADDCKITLESIYDGILANKASRALNYVEITALQEDSEDGHIVELYDNLAAKKRTIRAKNIIFATGPFTDTLLAKLGFSNWSPAILPTKGSHIWLKKSSLNIDTPAVLQTKDGRIIFVMPYPDKILVGTTEIILQSADFNIRPTNEEIDYILDNIAAYFPDFEANHSQIISSYAGIRPLVLENSTGAAKNAHKVSRNHKVFTIGTNISVIIGGKLTTYRTMGQKLSAKIVKQNGRNYDASKSKQPLSYRSKILPFERKKNISPEDIFDIITNEKIRTFEDLVKRRMGIYTLAHWHYQQDFKGLFLSIFEKIKDRIKISKEEIESFN